MITRLNLGSGKDYREGYVNIDILENLKVDIRWDLNEFPYPYQDNHFSEVLLKNILEHLDKPYETMKEIYRISKPNAKINIMTPHFSSIHCWGDMQHKRGFSVRTFLHDNSLSMFEVVKQEIKFCKLRFFIKPIAEYFPIFYEKNLAYIFPAHNLEIELREGVKY